ncbi:MAG: ADP-ribosylglycohydrolase family protein [Gemmataceae bacterium]
MLGAIAGDIIGSIYEWQALKSKRFPLFDTESCFTDDTVLTIAVADWILHDRDLVDTFHDYFHAYPQAGYGGNFTRWAGYRKRKPYNSWGNGSAMRVSPVGFAYDTLEEVLTRAEQSAAVTHDHPEGIRGAQATAAAIFLAKQGNDKDVVKTYITETFGYDLDQTLDDIRPRYTFDVSCQGSVPQSIRAFLESTDYADAVKNAVSLGGDADTMACIAGGIAEAHYGLPELIATEALARLDGRLRNVVEQFRERFGHA